MCWVPQRALLTLVQLLVSHTRLVLAAKQGVLIGQRVREVRGKYRVKTSSKEVKEAFFLPCGNHASYCPGPGLIVEDDSFYNHRHCKSGTEQSQNTTVQLHDFTQLYDSSHALLMDNNLISISCGSLHHLCDHACKEQPLRFQSQLIPRTGAPQYQVEAWFRGCLFKSSTLSNAKIQR